MYNAAAIYGLAERHEADGLGPLEQVMSQVEGPFGRSGVPCYNGDAMFTPYYNSLNTPLVATGNPEDRGALPSERVTGDPEDDVDDDIILEILENLAAAETDQDANSNSGNDNTSGVPGMGIRTRTRSGTLTNHPNNEEKEESDSEEDDALGDTGVVDEVLAEEEDFLPDNEEAGGEEEDASLTGSIQSEEDFLLDNEEAGGEEEDGSRTGSIQSEEDFLPDNEVAGGEEEDGSLTGSIQSESESSLSEDDSLGPEVILDFDSLLQQLSGNGSSGAQLYKEMLTNGKIGNVYKVSVDLELGFVSQDVNPLVHQVELASPTMKIHGVNIYDPSIRNAFSKRTQKKLLAGISLLPGMLMELLSRNTPGGHGEGDRGLELYNQVRGRVNKLHNLVEDAKVYYAHKDRTQVRQELIFASDDFWDEAFQYPHFPSPYHTAGIYHIEKVNTLDRYVFMDAVVIRAATPLRNLFNCSYQEWIDRKMNLLSPEANTAIVFLAEQLVQLVHPIGFRGCILKVIDKLHGGHPCEIPPQYVTRLSPAEAELTGLTYGVAPKLLPTENSMQRRWALPEAGVHGYTEQRVFGTIASQIEMASLFYKHTMAVTAIFQLFSRCAGVPVGNDALIVPSFFDAVCLKRLFLMSFEDAIELVDRVCQQVWELYTEVFHRRVNKSLVRKGLPPFTVRITLRSQVDAIAAEDPRSEFVRLLARGSAGSRRITKTNHKAIRDSSKY